MESYTHLLPDIEDVEFYQKSGYYISKPIYTEQEIDLALEGMERIYRNDLDRPGSDPFHTFMPAVNFGEGLRKTDYASFFNLALQKLITKPVLGAIAGKLTGSSQIRLWHDQLLFKPPQISDLKSNVGWHNDRMYWKTCTSDSMLTAWIPFHDCDETTGTITMIEGSKHWPDNTQDLDFFSSELDSLEKRFVTGGQRVKKVPMILPKGCVSFHNCLTIHGSGPNLSKQPRRSIAVHLQDETNRYQRYFYEDGSLADHGNDHLANKVDGVPDYTDNKVCPLLFSSIFKN